MRNRRRNRGFEPGGSFPPDQLGLSAARARELVLHRGWRRVVGPLNRRIRVIELRRGTLGLAFDPADGDDIAALSEMLPTLVGRLAAACPRLGIRRFRVVGRDGERAGPIAPVEMPTATDAASIEAQPGQATDGGRRLEPDPTDPETRLSRVMQRCLSRAQKP